jgi:hypothetical protein
MREIRTWGSVRGVLSDQHPYRDRRRDATGAPFSGRNKGRRGAAPCVNLAESGKSGSARAARVQRELRSL